MLADQPLSGRLRPGAEAAPWVIEAISRLEGELREARAQARAVARSADSLGFLQAEVHLWANQTFPDRLPANAWLKLFEELGEAIKAPTEQDEWADVMILLLDLATMHNVDLAAAVREKLDVNRARSWVKMPSGVYQHKEG